MIDRSHEFDHWRGKGVVVLKMNKQFEVPSFKRRVFWATDETIKAAVIRKCIIDTQFGFGVLPMDSIIEPYR